MANLLITIFEEKIYERLFFEEPEEFPIQTFVNQTLLGQKDPPLVSGRSFRQTVSYLKSKCEHTQKFKWTKQLALPIIFRIRDDKFKTTTLAESFFTEKNKNKNLYHYFELFDAKDLQF